MFIIFYKHCLSKISELKKPTAKVKIWDLINYSTICCWIRTGTTVVWNWRWFCTFCVVWGITNSFIRLLVRSLNFPSLFFCYKIFIDFFGWSIKKNEINVKWKWKEKCHIVLKMIKLKIKTLVPLKIHH